MKIAVIGVGAVGGYFGGRLAQAGHDVAFLARGGTLEALRNQGLRVRSVAGDFEIRHPKVADDPTHIGHVEVILLAVKAPQIRQVAASLAPLIGPETAIIPLQNGLEAPAMLSKLLGPGRVLGGLCKIFATKTADATVEHIGLPPAIEFGELNREKSARVERIRTELSSAQGMTTVTPDDIEAAMWEKLLYVEPLGAVGAVARAPAGVLRSVPETRRLLQSAMQEVVAVGLKRGVALDPNLPERAMKRVDQLPAEATASMQRDLMDGRPSEFEYQVGTVVRYGAESGAPTPVHAMIYAALLPGDLRSRGELP